MKIKNYWLLALGIFLVVIGGYDLIIGETNSAGSGNMSSITITFESNPVRYSLSILFKLVMGVLCVNKALGNKRDQSRFK